MSEQLLEMPLPGRTLPMPAAIAGRRAIGARLPTFVAGPENRVVASVVGQWLVWADAAGRGSCAGAAPLDGFALSSADAVGPHAEQPPPPGSSGMLTLFGPSGAGKTHIARGLVQYWQERQGREAAEYVTAGDFCRQFADSLRTDNAAIRGRFRGRPLLAIDDIHELPDNGHLLRELRYTLDDIQETGGKVLVTSPRAPGALANLPADIRSRLADGLVLQLSVPGAAARQQIVEQAAAVLDRPLTKEAARRLVCGVPGAANELFGALFELLAGVSAAPVVDAPQVERLLAARAVRRPALREIIAVVARYCRIPQKLLKSGSRRHAVVMGRAIIVYLARELADASFEQIGRGLGGRDHSTIMHNYRTIQRDRLRDWQTQETLDELRRILLSR